MDLREFADKIITQSVGKTKLRGISGQNYDFSNFRKAYVSQNRNNEIKRRKEEEISLRQKIKREAMQKRMIEYLLKKSKMQLDQAAAGLPSQSSFSDYSQVKEAPVAAPAVAVKPNSDADGENESGSENSLSGQNIFKMRLQKQLEENAVRGKRNKVKWRRNPKVCATQFGKK